MIIFFEKIRIKFWINKILHFFKGVFFGGVNSVSAFNLREIL